MTTQQIDHDQFRIERARFRRALRIAETAPDTAETRAAYEAAVARYLQFLNEQGIQL